MIEIELQENLVISTLIKNKVQLDEVMQKQDDVEIDFRNVDKVDSSGLDLLANFMNKMKVKKKKVYFVNMKREIQDVFDLVSFRFFS